MTENRSPRRSVEELRADARDQGWVESSDFDVPTIAVDSDAELVTTVWRVGFAAGWAARDTRDDEPDVGATVWLVNEDGEECVARRQAERGDVMGDGIDAVWEVSGRHGLMAWVDMLSEAQSWGRLTKEGR